jgi:hypothetical protein
MTTTLLDSSLFEFVNQFPTAVTIYQTKGKNSNGLNDYHCIFANTKAVDLFEVSQSDFLSKSIFEIFPLFSSSISYSKIEEVIDNGIAQTYEYEKIDKNQWLQISISKYKDGFILHTTDITEKNIAEIRLKSAQNLLQLANWELNNFTNF